MQLSSKAIRELDKTLQDKGVFLSEQELQEFGLYLLTITAESIKLR